jgi:Holliday junction resolvase RusA-like endonuclease
MCSEKANIERLNSVRMVYKGSIMGKVRMSVQDRWKKRPCVMRYWEFKDRLVAQAKEQNFKLGNEIMIQIIIEMPKSWSKKKKEFMIGMPHQQRPDVDNIAKGIMDSLLENDSCVYSLFAEKYWGLENIIYIENGVKDELLRNK